MTAVLAEKRAPEAFKHRVVSGFTRADLARLFAEKGYTRGAEIGVADGRFSRVLCDSIPGLQLLCVDPYQRYQENPRGGPQEQHERNWDIAHERLHGFNVRFVREMSMDAVDNVPHGSLDFVFIDGHHGFEFVVMDLIAWSKRVRNGGIVAGHDFYEFPKRKAGVVEAVEAYTKAYDITDWHICDEREPAFWWVKS
jgi:hypothetical protein